MVGSEYATDGQFVEGLLISDGTTVELSRGLRDAGYGYRTLSSIGYRDHLYGQDGLTRAVEPGEPTSPQA